MSEYEDSYDEAFDWFSNMEATFNGYVDRIIKKHGPSRELSLAKTNMEQAGMWARRHLEKVR